MKRFHPEYSQSTLQIRSFLHSLRSMWRPTDFERQNASIQGELDRLDRLRPGRVSVRHMFISELSRRTASLIEASGGDSNDPWVPKLIIKSASSHLEELSLAEQAIYQRRAVEHVMKKRADIESRRLELLEAKTLLHARAKEDVRRNGLPNAVASCRFTPPPHNNCFRCQRIDLVRSIKVLILIVRSLNIVLICVFVVNAPVVCAMHLRGLQIFKISEPCGRQPLGAMTDAKPEAFCNVTCSAASVCLRCAFSL